jgi:hypothetical protein
VTGAFTTDNTGNVPGWVDRNSSDYYVDITIPPASTKTVLIPGTGSGGGVSVPLILDAAAAANPVLELGVTSATAQSVIFHADGSGHWTDGTNPSQVELILDSFWNSTNALGLFPENGGNESQITIYGGAYAARGGSNLDGSAILLDAQNSATILNLSYFNAANGEGLIQLYADGASSSIAFNAPPSGGGAGLGHQAISLGANSDGNANINIRTSTTYGGSPLDTGGLSGVPTSLNLYGFGGGVSALRYTLYADGSMQWSDGDGTYDTTLRPGVPGVLQIVEDGGGIMLTSPDGLTTKQIQLSNAGALVLI